MMLDDEECTFSRRWILGYVESVELQKHFHKFAILRNPLIEQQTRSYEL